MIGKFQIQILLPLSLLVRKQRKHNCHWSCLYSSSQLDDGTTAWVVYISLPSFQIQQGDSDLCTQSGIQTKGPLGFKVLGFWCASWTQWMLNEWCTHHWVSLIFRYSMFQFAALIIKSLLTHTVNTGPQCSSSSSKCSSMARGFFVFHCGPELPIIIGKAFV